jgi:hypothetical protein
MKEDDVTMSSGQIVQRVLVSCRQASAEKQEEQTGAKKN